MITSSEKRGSSKPRTKPKNNNSQSKDKKKKKPVVTTVEHKHEVLKKGDPCPEEGCKGKLYPFRPKVFIRITAHAPYESTRHLLETLRCNLCGQRFTANAPEDVLQDGDINQHYGYSARSLMVMNKFFSGQGYHHQDDVSDLMGARVSSSTIFDQCEQVANDLMPLYYQLMREAANAELLLGDDTTHRILDQKPEKRPNRTSKGERTRTGVYASCLIAKTEENTIVLFETSLGHLGEFLDKVLDKRKSELPAPILMTDALSSNNSTVIPTIKTLCNVHARRKFYDIEKLHPEVTPILNMYDKVWENNQVVNKQALDKEARQRYHHQHSLPLLESISEFCQKQL